MRVVHGHTLPEGAVFTDEGCHLHPSCLSCPRKICFHDEARSQQTLNARHRAREIMKLHKKGKGPTEIGRILRLSSRTVHRVLAEGPPTTRKALEDDDAPPTLSLDKLARKSPIKPRKPWPQLMRRTG